MSNFIDSTLEYLMQEAKVVSKRVIDEDRPDLVFHAAELVSVASQLARVCKLPEPIDVETYVADLKKRFLLATTLPVVPGIYADSAVAAPIDPAPLRRGGTTWLGVGLIEYRQVHEAVDAPRYFPDQQYYGFIVPHEPEDGWYVVREKGDVSFVMQLERQWVKSSGSDMVIVRDVLGLGREALKMAAETEEELPDWAEQARTAFSERLAALARDSALLGIPGFYHLGTKSFYRHPWSEADSPTR